MKDSTVGGIKECVNGLKVSWMGNKKVKVGKLLNRTIKIYSKIKKKLKNKY